MPTLLIQGDADQSSPLELTAKRTHHILPDSRLKVYAGKAHGIYITEAPRLKADLLEFMNSPSASASACWK